MAKGKNDSFEDGSRISRSFGRRRSHLATAILLLAGAAFCALPERRQAAPAGRVGMIYAPGHAFDRDGDAFQDHDLTLLVSLSSRCRFSQESMEPLRRLVTDLIESRARPQIVVVGRESRAALLKLTGDQLAYADKILSPAPRLSSAVTPALAVVDRSAEIQAVWIGRVTEERQRDVASYVARRHTRNTLLNIRQWFLRSTI